MEYRYILVAMAMCVRIFMVLVLTAFSAATIVHGANGTTMKIKMAIAAVEGVDMGDCQDCPNSNDNMSQCDSICVSPVFAVVPSGPIYLPEVKVTTTNTIAHSMIGHRWSPEPYPPRSIV